MTLTDPERLPPTLETDQTGEVAGGPSPKERMKAALDDPTLQNYTKRIADRFHGDGMSKTPTEDDPVARMRLGILANRLRERGMSPPEMTEFMRRSMFRYHEKRSAEEKSDD